MNTVMISGNVYGINGNGFFLKVDDSYQDTQRHFFAKVLVSPDKMPEKGANVLVSGYLGKPIVIESKDGNKHACDQIIAGVIVPMEQDPRINRVCMVGTVMRKNTFQTSTGNERGSVTIAYSFSKEEGDVFYPTAYYGNGQLKAFPYVIKGRSLGITASLAAATYSNNERGEFINTNLNGFQLTLTRWPSNAGNDFEPQDGPVTENVSEEDIPF